MGILKLLICSFLVHVPAIDPPHGKPLARMHARYIYREEHVAVNVKSPSRPAIAMGLCSFAVLGTLLVNPRHSGGAMDRRHTQPIPLVCNPGPIWSETGLSAGQTNSDPR